MAKPRKKWEPSYHFGGNIASFYVPQPLGGNQRQIVIKPKPKKRTRQ